MARRIDKAGIDRGFRAARKGEAGIALPVALWLAALVAVIGAGALMIAGADLRFATSIAERSAARHWAEGVAALAALRLAEADPIYQAALTSGETLELRQDDSVAAIVLSRESARLDLNSAEPIEIAALLADLGYARDRAESLAAAIADSRDADDLVRLGGAEAAAYAEAGVAQKPLNRPFLSFEELGLVLGVDRVTSRALAERGTVWVERPGPVGVDDLQALRDGRIEGDAARLWAGALQRGQIAESEELGGDALRIEVAARVASGGEARLTWIILVDRRNAPPFRVLDRF